MENKHAKKARLPQLAALALTVCLQLGAAVSVAAQELKAPALYEQCETLAAASANEAVIRALALLKDAKAEQRSAAASQLAKSCDTRAVEPLVNALKDADAQVRSAAAAALGQLGEPTAIEPLIELLKDSDWRVRTAAALSLGSFNIHKPRNAVLNAFVNTGSNPLTDVNDVRARCFGVLVINQMRDVRFSRKAISFLFDFLEQKDPAWRASAEQAALELHHTRNGVHEMIGILKISNLPAFRRQAAYWLGRWGAAEARDILTEAAANDRDESVKKAAATALAALPKQ